MKATLGRKEPLLVLAGLFVCHSLELLAAQRGLDLLRFVIEMALAPGTAQRRA